MLNIDVKTKIMYTCELTYYGAGWLYTDELHEEWHRLFHLELETIAKYFGVVFQGQGLSWETDYVAIFESTDNDKLVKLKKWFDGDWSSEPTLKHELDEIATAMRVAEKLDEDGCIREYHPMQENKNV